MEQCKLCTKDQKGDALPKESKLFGRHKDDVKKLIDNGYLPNINEERRYEVFIMKKKPFASHWSVIVTYDKDHYISIHLVFMEEKGKRYVYPLVEPIDKKYVSKFEPIGPLTMKGEYLMTAAWDAMVEFGYYNPVYKNCQDFCKRYLERIGLQCPLTDFGKIKRVSSSSLPCLASPQGPRSSGSDESDEDESRAEEDAIALQALRVDIQDEAEKSLLGSSTETAGMPMTKESGDRRPETKYTLESA